MKVKSAAELNKKNPNTLDQNLNKNIWQSLCRMQTIDKPAQQWT